MAASTSPQAKPTNAPVRAMGSAVAGEVAAAMALGGGATSVPTAGGVDSLAPRALAPPVSEAPGADGVSPVERSTGELDEESTLASAPPRAMVKSLCNPPTCAGNTWSLASWYLITRAPAVNEP